MKRILILVLGLMIATAALAQDARYTTKVGDETMVAIQTPHPAPAAGRGDPAWQDTLRWEKATYIAVHFAKMELAPGEKVTISTPDGKFAYSYTGCGRSKTCSPFWAAHVPGDTAVITYYANGEEPGFGYIIDAYAHGYPAPWRFPEGATEGICGSDNTQNAICYQSTEPAIYDNSRAVARLLSGGSALCTAWLFGCDGHAMTNNHCISAQSGVDSADFEFMAEGATCATNCTTSPYCPGTIWDAGTSGTFVTTNYNADYTVILLPQQGGQKPSDVYGYLKLKTAPPAVGDRFYLPGHPAGWGKRIAVTSDSPNDPTGFCAVATLDYAQCQGTGGPLDISYWADTQGGSSGSPVIDYNDNKVLAIHHCNAGGGACPNRGVPMDFIVNDLQTGGNLPNCATQQFNGTVKFDANTYICDDIVTITVKDDNLIGNPSQTVTIVSTTETTPETVTLLPLPAPNENTFVGSIALGPPPAANGDSTLSVVTGDSITVTYIDLDDGQGNTNVPVTATAAIDCIPPVISNVSSSNVTGQSAIINWLTDEPATSTVRYGLSAPPGSTSSSGVLVTSHAHKIQGLTECSSYVYSVASQDDAGNLAADDNSGAYYTFATGKNVNPTYTSADTPLPIPDNTPAGVTSTINVPFFDYITKATVTVNITHTFDGDLSLSLIAPNATVIPLSTRRGSSGDNFTGTTFDDDATTPIASGAAPFTGSFKPESPLSVLAGIASYGDWQLKAVDSAGADVGTIVDWSLNLSFPPAPCGAAVILNQPAYSCTSQVGITVKDTNVAGATVTVSVQSTTEPTPETVTLTRLAAPQDTWFTGSIQLAPPPPTGGDGQLSVVNGDTITVSYLDADDGQGNTNVTVTTTATTQCVGPTISNVSASNIGGSTAQINWTTNNPSSSVVRYGLAIPPGQTASNASLVTTHALPITGLTPCSTYYYSVESTDVYGNTAIDNNGGLYYNFTTPQSTNASFTSTDTPLLIPDNNAAGVTSTINVPDLDTVTDVNVTVNIQHTWSGDVTLYLIGPNSTQVTLVARRGSSGDNFTNTVFDDSATTPIASGVAPFTGSFKPELPLSALNGISAAGAWQLKATDSVSTDSGQILDWTLSLAYQPRVCGPSAQYFSHTFTDACASGGTGGGNGAVDRGEDITMPLTVRNNGAVTLTGVSATLTTTTPGVTITRGTATFPDVASGLTTVSNTPHFEFVAGPSVPCGSDIAFNVAIQTAQGTFNGSFTQKVGLFTTATSTIASTDVPKAIPDSNTAGVTSVIPVADTSIVTDVDVQLSITHTWDGDLSLSLIAPNGTIVPLSTRRGSSGDNFTGTIFDDSATTPIGSGSPPYAGSFKPESPLNVLNGIAANGTWTLKAVDGAAGDVGTITAWSLILTVQSGWACTDCTPATPTASPQLQVWTSKTEQQWEPIATATEYHLYRGAAGDLAKLLTADPDSCLRLNVPGTSTGAVLTEAPGTGGLYWYLVRAANGVGEGPAGSATAGPRDQSSTGACP